MARQSRQGVVRAFYIRCSAVPRLLLNDDGKAGMAEARASPQTRRAGNPMKRYA
jgi:hypothetical protein